MQLWIQINNFIEDWHVQNEISGRAQTITLYPVHIHANDDVDVDAKDLLREL
jgi:hypothetical protein